MILALTAAALAAIAPALPAANAQPAPAAAAMRTSEHKHVRTTLIGERGPVVALIPGMSTPGSMWEEIAGKLATEHRVLIVEVKGFDGRAEPANREAGLIDGIVEDLARDLDERGLGRPVIAGHSFGGLVAMKFALDRPKSVGSLVVVDALPFFGTVFAPDATVESITPRAKAMRDMMTAQADAIRARAAQPMTKDPGGNMSVDPDRRMRIADWSMKADPLVVAQALWEDLQLDLRKDITAIKVPMTVLYQAQDDERLAKQRYSIDYAAKSDALLMPVKGTGHFIPLDRPDAVRAAIAVAAHQGAR